MGDRQFSLFDIFEKPDNPKEDEQDVPFIT
jgi:hypothetical protein